MTDENKLRKGGEEVGKGWSSREEDDKAERTINKNTASMT